MQSRSKIPQRVRGSNGDLPKEGLQSAGPQRLRRRDCRQDKNTCPRDSQGDRESQNPNTCRHGTVEELQLEREKTKTLQEELERVRASYEEDRQKYEADVLTVTQRADDLQLQLDSELESCAKRRPGEDEISLQKLTAEQDAEPQGERQEDKLQKLPLLTQGSLAAIVALALVLLCFFFLRVFFTSP